MADVADKTSLTIREAAAEWVVRLSTTEVGVDEESEFSEWIRRSPEHVKEYLRAEAAWLAMDGATKQDDTDVATLLRAAPRNVFALTAVEGALRDVRTPASEQRQPSRNRVRAAIAAGVLLVFGLAAAAPWLAERFQAPSYSTAVGEQRRIVLADGSNIELNTDSQVRVQLQQEIRKVYLDAGEAFFEVAKDPTRPFVVISDTAVVRAVGTQFNVYRQTGKTVVTVIEGRVAAQAQGDSPVHAVELAAGHAITIPSGRTLIAQEAQPTVTNTRTVTAWRQRRLIFDNEALVDVIAEFNRYNRRQLVVEDALLAADRISGVFDADQPQALVRFLMQQSNVQATEVSDLRVVLTRSPE